MEEVVEANLTPFDREQLKAITEEAKKFSKVGKPSIKFLRSFMQKSGRFVFQYCIEGGIIDSAAFRATRQEIPMGLTISCWVGPGEAIHNLGRKILATLRHAWMHEFEEMFMYDNHPVYNPHPDDSQLLKHGEVIVAHLKPDGIIYETNGQETPQDGRQIQTQAIG